MNAITVQDMYICLKNAVNEGLGDKKILLSGDDEGNSFHECFFGISPTKDNIWGDAALPYGVSMEDAEENYVILG